MSIYQPPPPSQTRGERKREEEDQPLHQPLPNPIPQPLQPEKHRVPLLVLVHRRRRPGYNRRPVPCGAAFPPSYRNLWHHPRAGSSSGIHLVRHAVGHGDELDEEEVEARRGEEAGGRVRGVVRGHYGFEGHVGGCGQRRWCWCWCWCWLGGFERVDGDGDGDGGSWGFGGVLRPPVGIGGFDGVGVGGSCEAIGAVPLSWICRFGIECFGVCDGEVLVEWRRRWELQRCGSFLACRSQLPLSDACRYGVRKGHMHVTDLVTTFRGVNITAHGNQGTKHRLCFVSGIVKSWHIHPPARLCNGIWTVPSVPSHCRVPPKKTKPP